MTSVPILKLPRWLLTLGFEPVRAGVVTYSIVASVATVMAIGLWLSLRKTTGNGAAAERYSFFGLVRAGLKAARAPAVALSYGASFASAANMSVVGAFLTVWTVRYGETVGLSSAEGLALGGSLFMVMQIGSMLFMPIYGPMMDKLGPLRGLILGLSLATLGYSLTIFMDHPGDGYSYAVCALLGVSQAAMILSAQVFVQSEAPPEVRGTVIGFFAVSAGAGGVVALQLGGYLFDAWHYSGPFVLGGVIDLAVLAWAVSLLSTMARPTQPDKG